MNKPRVIVAFATMMAMGLAAPLAAYAQTSPSTTKQRSGDGDTGRGDRPNAFGKQAAGDGDTGFGDRSTRITKQRTGDGDTGFGDRPSPTGGRSRQ